MSIVGLLKENYMTLLTAMGKTLELTLLSLVFASLIGLLFGLLNVSKKKWMHVVANVYIDAIRGVPLIVLAFFIYFGIPLATGIKLDALIAGIISLSLNAGAYMAEIVRAGIQSIDKGQLEAARSLGLPYGTAMRRVVLPQAIRVMIPSIINQFIITLKDTSILSVIGFPELTKAGSIIIARNYETFKMWAIIGVMYLIVITTLSKIAKALERRISYGK
ncbi:polar amino acid transport system permease protein [Lachnotalea glycerini]|jgi:glutamine transport system permease protein|uniref:Amino acid ABC transporter permease n=1 Tax=Lachnotalea glycerini TaxID=1763509 RepID=A0A255I3Z2_9FIRM|nr:amino acid ABC transporter permease [Lachnotalea glycerini]PXV93583.1 polar amino acid transport system permease protein [Lachnotalea glycerini]RDY32540.1 amino acid ABC transporter permease [Lachnotalea glycerini]